MRIFKRFMEEFRRLVRAIEKIEGRMSEMEQQKNDELHKLDRILAIMEEDTKSKIAMRATQGRAIEFEIARAAEIDAQRKKATEFDERF